MTEIDEFYPYVEMEFVAQNVGRFRGSFDGGKSSLDMCRNARSPRADWTTASQAKRRVCMEMQLELFESPVAETRRAAQGRVLYLLQGKFLHG